MTEKYRKILAAAAFAVFLIFCALVTVFIGVPMVHLAEEPELFRDWVDTFGIWSRMIFIGMVALQVVVALIPGGPLQIAGGYAFGVLEGTLCCMVGIVIGSCLVFGLVRKFGVKMVEVFFQKKEIRRLEFLKNPKKTRVIVFILMLIPGAPKDFLSYFVGLTQLKWKEWLAIVVVGRLPSLVMSTISGGAAGSENYLLAVVVLAITLVISGLGVLYYRWMCKHQQAEEEQELQKVG